MDIEGICASIASTGERAVAANVLKWWQSLGAPFTPKEAAVQVISL
jgi:hypothetical protein